MRPLDEVLAAAREAVASGRGLDDFTPDSYCYGDLRRELEEWEARYEVRIDELVAVGSLPSAINMLQAKLAEIRQLLGRGEPEPHRVQAVPVQSWDECEAAMRLKPLTANKDDGMSISDAVEHVLAKPRLASPAMRALVEACEVAHEAIDIFLADQSYAKDPRCGLVQPVTVDDCHELSRAFNLLGSALAIARAELREEAERG